MSKRKEPEEELYTVERILDERRGRKGVEYLIRWQGYLPEDDTWEPAGNIPNEVIRTYLQPIDDDEENEEDEEDSYDKDMFTAYVNYLRASETPTPSEPSEGVRERVERRFTDLIQAVASDDWSNEFRSALQRLPNLTSSECVNHHVCDACRRERVISYQLTLSTPYVSSMGLWGAKPTYEQYHVNCGKFCHYRVIVYHNLVHFKFKLSLALKSNSFDIDKWAEKCHQLWQVAVELNTVISSTSSFGQSLYELTHLLPHAKPS